MFISIFYSKFIPMWYLLTLIIITIFSSMIIIKKYNTNDCYDGTYINTTMYDLIQANMILYLIVAIGQIIIFMIVLCKITKEKTLLIIISNIICFLVMGLLNGMYLNFILTNTNNCLSNIKINQIYVYVYFIITFILTWISQILILFRISCITYID